MEQGRGERQDASAPKTFPGVQCCGARSLFNVAKERLLDNSPAKLQSWLCMIR